MQLSRRQTLARPTSSGIRDIKTKGGLWLGSGFRTSGLAQCPLPVGFFLALSFNNYTTKIPVV